MTGEALNIATAGWQQARDLALRYMALEAAAYRCAGQHDLTRPQERAHTVCSTS